MLGERAQVIITVIISGSTVLVRTLTTSHRRFRNLDEALGRTLWTSDQPPQRPLPIQNNTT
jgi:hypothetical protein